ncbi:Biotin synthase [hydrothermal vent metagenome]|uniref:biotin synthase n=1 Tax=hydrothermal vent metagenome TaxID=652676 RepID=A0A1W1CD70_9ZZZZ
MSKKIFLCAINNILSGTCAEDCKFCTQSVRYRADIERYHYKDIDQIVQEAKAARANGALGYCLVTAGKGLDDKKVDFVARAAKAIKNEVAELNLIACNGTATKEQLSYLKKHGIDSYNHNLETSERYYGEICKTHTWSERYETCENIKSIGLTLCSGGIFGMGETHNDRDELLKSIASLSPESTPLNFYHPNPALPIKTRNIERDEALNIIKKARTLLGKENLLMVAGGRELLFTGEEQQMFESGANAIVIGNYLTTKGIKASADKKMLDTLGYEVAKNCDR